jgi:hypothetical protein
MPRAALLNPFAALLFMEAARALNRKASAKRARWATHTGRPFAAISYRHPARSRSV